MAKKRRLADGESKKPRVDLSHVVPMTSSSLHNIVVEFPKEIEEDLERRKIESYKALAAQGSKKPARTTSAPDAAQDFYERAKGLDVPAVMVPKPWSEVDQILTKLKTADSPSPTPLAKKPVAAKLAETQQPETIDMSELMDDLDELDEDEDKTSKKKAEIIKPSMESVTPEDLPPKPIRSLETSLSFSTFHTVKEMEGGNAKPETVTNILKAHSSLKSPAAVRRSESAAIAPTTPRKVNVNPRLLARMEAFM